MELITLKERSGRRYIDQDIRASSIFPVLAYDDDTDSFINDDKTMGFSFLCQPLYGADGQVEERMKSFLNTDFPAGTILSILWFRSPDIVRQMTEMKMLREETGYRNPLMEAVINERAEFLERGTLSPVDKHMGQLFYDLRIVITVKMPIQEQFPTREDEIKIATYQ